MARFTTPNSMRNLLAGEIPDEWKTGPVIAQAAYPDVLVARAVTDGRALDLVLRPGTEGGRTALGLKRLAPRHTYAVIGGVDETVTADDNGCAIVTVDLEDRLELAVRPLDP